MSISGIGSRGLPPATSQTNAIKQQQRAPQTASVSVLGTPGVIDKDALPVDAPAGTDPAFWAVLTTEERQFFARHAALGPATYGRLTNQTQQNAPVGGRLDVRV